MNEHKYACVLECERVTPVLSYMTVMSSTRISQPCAAQEIFCPIPSSMIFVVKYSVQQRVQNSWPHSSPVIVEAGIGTRQMSHSTSPPTAPAARYE